MKKIMMLAVVALSAVVLVACAPSDPAPEPDGVPSEETMEIARTVCAILDDAGVAEGIPLLIQIGNEAGVHPNTMADIILLSVRASCPEYESELVVTIG